MHVPMSLEAQPLRRSEPLEALMQATIPAPSHDLRVKTASLFFGSSSLGGSVESIERWQPGEEPLIVMRRDPDMKVASLPPPTEEHR